MSIRPAIPDRNLTEMTLEDMRALLARLGQPAYRAGQVYRWVFQRGIRALDEMTDLPKRLRAQLADEGYEVGRVELGRVAESIDGTRKLSVRLKDGAAVESVLIPMGENQFTQCLSSQVGCAFGVSSVTGTMGLSGTCRRGNRRRGHSQSLPEGARISHGVHGYGEPLHNFDGVIGSLKAICHEDGLGYSYSGDRGTSGLVPHTEKSGRLSPLISPSA